MGGVKDCCLDKRFRQKMRFKNAFMSETVLQSVIACKGSDNLWLELLTKEVHASIMILLTAHDLYGFNHVYLGQNKIFTHAIKDFWFCLGLCAVYQIDE